MIAILHQHGHGHSHGGGHGHSHGGARRSREGEEEEGREGGKKQAQLKNINVHAAFIHVIGDLIQSVGIVIAGYIIWFKVSVLSQWGRKERREGGREEGGTEGGGREGGKERR